MLLDTAEEDRQVLGFVNPIVDSDDEDEGIFQPEKSFCRVFNFLVNQCCIEMIKMCEACI